MMKRQEQGYVALLAVLVVGTVATGVGLLLLTTGVDGQRMAIASQSSTQARGLVGACADEALMTIRNNQVYTGTGNLNLGAGSCTYTVTNTGTNNRTIAITATVNSVVRRAQVYVTIGTSSISVTSWQEVT
jgi:hypothetical protein